MVRLYAVTETDEGTYVATQFVPGARTLAESGRTRPGRRRRWVDEAATILRDAEHGRLTASDILIGGDGRVWLTGFGRPPEEDDATALERIRTAQQSRPLLAVAAATGVLAVAGAAAALTLSGDGEPAQPVPAPPVTEGATAIGSSLAPGSAETVDCDGRVPSGSSITCTVMQTELDGRPLVAPFAGIVRAWAVRGAKGRLALQILKPKDDGFTRYNGTRVVTVNDPDAPRVFRADRLVPKGARFGIEIAPGGGVGIRSAGPGASTSRFFGLLRGRPERADPRWRTAAGAAAARRPRPARVLAAPAAA